MHGRDRRMHSMRCAASVIDYLLILAVGQKSLTNIETFGICSVFVYLLFKSSFAIPFSVFYASIFSYFFWVTTFHSL